jgi:hypothetical protein
VIALHDAVAGRPRLKTYLASERRIAFNEMRIFRHYPELVISRWTFDPLNRSFACLNEAVRLFFNVAP